MDIVLKTIQAKVTRTSQREVAIEMGVSPQYISDILAGRRAVSEAVAGKLGFEKSCVWKKMAKVEEGK